MKKNRILVLVMLCAYSCISDAQATGKLSAKEQVAEFGKLIKKIERLAGSDIIEGDQAALQVMRTTTDLLIDNLRTHSGRRKAARLMLWSRLIYEFAQDLKTISDYESVARLDILNFIERRLKAQYSVLDSERLKTPEGEIRRKTLLALNELVTEAVTQLIDPTSLPPTLKLRRTRKLRRVFDRS